MRRKKADWKVFVSGSVHLDIVSQVTAHADTLDKIGSLSIEVGGTAYNVAMNLLSMGVGELCFHTALKKSPISGLLVEALKETRALIEYDSDLPLSGFNAHLRDGELVSAISSVSIENRVISPSVAVRQALEQACFAVFDCNHHPTTLSLLAAVCAERGIPFALCAVSEGKALKIPRVGIPPACIFLNATEWRYLHAHFPEWRPAADTLVFITDGPRGASVYVGGQELRSVGAPEVEATCGHFLGAGDAFAAGALHSLFLSQGGLDLALEQGARAAAEIIARPNCSAGAANLLDRHLDTLRDRAECDHLTGLRRRGPGLAFLRELCSRRRIVGEPFSVLFIDLDRFKLVNDTHGHTAGDAVLKASARLIRETLRENDMAVRWGGEEFVAILPACDHAAAVGVAERILARLRAAVVPEVGRPVTASIGVAESRGEDETPDHLLARGDEMLYRAKEGGRDCVVGENTALLTAKSPKSPVTA